jgi:hypothetical protein
MKRAIGLRVGRYLWEIGRVIVAMAPAGLLVGLLQTTGWAQGEWAMLTFTLPMAIVAAGVYTALVWLLAGEENRAALRPTIASVRSRLRLRRK